MSSIISEVFYGSRQQKIIEEYLQRNENNPSEIQSKDQSYGQHFNLEFLITLPPILSVRSLLSVELGRHCIREEIDAYESDSTVSRIVFSSISMSSINSVLYAKITISSEGESLAFGFIPIEIIKELISNKKEKNTVVVIKGNKKWANRVLQCCIMVIDMENILSFEESRGHIGRSEPISRSKGRSSYESKKKSYDRSSELSVPKRSVTPKEQLEIDQSSLGSWKEWREVSLRLEACELFETNDTTTLSILLNKREIKVCEEFTLEKVSKNELEIRIFCENREIGTVTFCALLFLEKSQGEFPIINIETSQCIGSIILCSNIIQPIDQSLSVQTEPISEDKLNIIVIKLSHILIMSIQKEEEQFSSGAEFNIDEIIQEEEIKLLIRIGNAIYTFTDISARKLYNNSPTYTLKSPQSMEVIYKGEKDHNETILVEFEIYCGYVLISYSKLCIKMNNEKNFYDAVYIKGTSDAELDITVLVGLHIEVAFMIVNDKEEMLEKEVDCLGIILSDFVNKNFRLGQHDNIELLILNRYKQVTRSQAKHLASLIKEFWQFAGERSVIYKLNPPFYKELEESLLREFLYIDSNNEQSVSYSEFQVIKEYYKDELSSLSELNATVILHNNDESRIIDLLETKESDIVPYIWFVNGYLTCIDREYHEIENTLQNTITEQHTITEPDFGQSTLKEEFNREVQEHIPQTIYKAVQIVYLKRIDCFNLHCLNQNKTPNIMTNMTSKVYYSNSCPSIIVERDVDLSKPLILSHKNIAKNLIIPLCSIYLTYQTRVYDLDGSNKCKIEVIWG